MPSKPCPHCGYKHDPDVEKLGEELLAKLQPEMAFAERTTLLRLVEGNGAFVTRDQIAFTLYGHRVDGGPDKLDNIISTYISRLRGLVWPYGYTIENRAHLGYFINKVESSNDTHNASMHQPSREA